ncbi:recombinase family protein [Priestia aryabhattai]
MGINFGYVRVSTNEQNLDRQLEVIKPYLTDEKYLAVIVESEESSKTPP